MEKEYYVVMRIQTKIRKKVNDQITIDKQIGGCYGYLPVFETYEEAEKDSKGIYNIAALRLDVEKKKEMESNQSIEK